MAIEAVALLRIAPSALEQALGPAGGGGEAQPGGAGPRWQALDDAVLLFTRMPMRETDPEDIAAAVGELLGEALDAHDDERGILLFPDAAAPRARSYAAAVDEVGDLGEWVPVPDEAPMDGGLGALMGQLGPQIAAMQQQLLSDPAALQAAMAQVSSLLGVPTDPRGGMPDSTALLQAMGGLGMGGIDMGAMAAQAQRFVTENPDAAEQMMKSLGLAQESEDDDEGSRDTEPGDEPTLDPDDQSKAEPGETEPHKS
jgi:hypothetical protein